MSLLEELSMRLPDSTHVFNRSSVPCFVWQSSTVLENWKRSVQRFHLVSEWSIDCAQFDVYKTLFIEMRQPLPKGQTFFFLPEMFLTTTPSFPTMLQSIHRPCCRAWCKMMQCLFLGPCLFHPPARMGFRVGPKRETQINLHGPIILPPLGF